MVSEGEECPATYHIIHIYTSLQSSWIPGMHCPADTWYLQSKCPLILWHPQREGVCRIKRMTRECMGLKADKDLLTLFGIPIKLAVTIHYASIVAYYGLIWESFATPFPRMAGVPASLSLGMSMHQGAIFGVVSTVAVEVRNRGPEVFCQFLARSWRQFKNCLAGYAVESCSKTRCISPVLLARGDESRRGWK